MDKYLENPYVLIGGALLFLALLILWNQKNAKRARNRKNNTFRKRYSQKRKEHEDLHQNRR